MPLFQVLIWSLNVGLAESQELGVSRTNPSPVKQPHLQEILQQGEMSGLFHGLMLCLD